MSRGKWIAGPAVAAALIVTSITPAAARHGHGGWHHRHHDDDDIDAGDVLTGLLVLGGIVAVASAASKKRNPGIDNSPNDGSPDEYPDDTAPIGAEDAAVEACVTVAVRRASEDGRNASVREITRADSTDEGWEVHGVVESRQGYRAPYSDSRDFTCSVRYGQVEHFALDSSVAVR